MFGSTLLLTIFEINILLKIKFLLPILTFKMKLNIIFVCYSLLLCHKYVICFIPAKIIDFVLSSIDTSEQYNFGRVSETITHEEILKRGVAKSIAKFFYDQPGGSTRINLHKISNEYYDFRNIYRDYYNKTICTPKVSDIMLVELGPNVALVDLDPTTKDLPYAHFDAEKFNESNIRVMNFTKYIYIYLNNKNYEKARELTAQILHTIQDFYSHSNWLEMGNIYKINTAIGTQNFTLLPIADANDTQTCVSNCSLAEVKCSSFTQNLNDFLKYLNLTSALFECPIKFYKCKENLIKFDELTSGYYTGQKLDDGTAVPKPRNLQKCSHGGLIDLDAKIDPIGGINKDSGYYLFSPKADLHLLAANLAINHTEYFFNQIRQQIGDAEFDIFLELTYTQDELKSFSNNVTCNAFAVNFVPNSTLRVLILSLIFINFFLNFINS